MILDLVVLDVNWRMKCDVRDLFLETEEPRACPQNAASLRSYIV